MQYEPTHDAPVLGRSRPTGPVPKWRRPAAAFAVVGVAALVAAGCGSASKSTAPPAAAAATSAPTATAQAPIPGATAPTTAEAAANPATAANTITATLTEFNIALSRTDLTPGTYTFRAVDAGHIPHSLEVDGPGVDDRALPALLQPGQSADLTVTLRAGGYDVFCPVPGHKAMGMNLELTVTGAAATSSPPDKPTTTSSGAYGY